MKIFNLTLLLVLLTITSSCEFNLPINSVEGNGNVIKDTRLLKDKIDVVRASTGLEVILVESIEQSVTIEADENLIAHIETNFNDGVLHIKTNKNIRRAKSKKITVGFVELEGVETSSGASLKSLSTIVANNLYLQSSSGSQMDVPVLVKELSAKSSSGASIHIKGQSRNFNSRASSGSSINAKDLETIYCTSRASSSGEITLSVKKSLNAKASSSGDIKYYGNPETINQETSSSGSIEKQ